MNAGLHIGKILLRDDSLRVWLKVGRYKFPDTLPKDQDYLKPLADIYMGNFFDFMFTGDWFETFVLCYPKRPWDIPLWLEYGVSGNLILPKSNVEGNFIGDVDVDRSKEYLTSYKYLKNENTR